MSDHHHRSQFDQINFIRGAIIGIAIMALLGGVFFAGSTIGSGSKTDTSNMGDAGTSKGTTNGGVVAPTVPQPSANIQLALSKDDWVKGNPKAGITIVEYSDLECPFCKSLHPTLNRVLEEYEGDVNWVYRHFPLAALHKKAQREAEAAECAGDQSGNDGFWAYIDRLFEITPSNDGLADSQLPQIAADIGLNVATFQTCLDSGKFTEKVTNQYNTATAAGGRGTPYSVIVTADGDNIPVSGAVPYDQFAAIIDSLL